MKEDRADLSKRLRTGLFCLITVIILIRFFIDFKNTPEFSFEYLGKGPRDKTGELTSGTVFTQEIPYEYGCLGLSFMLSNSGHEISGNVMVRAVGETSGFVYVDQAVDEADYRGSEYVDLYFPKELPAEDETIMVTFTSTCTAGGAPILLTTHEDSIPGHSFIVDGEEMQTDLMARNIIHRRSYAVTQIINILKAALKIAAVYFLCFGKFWSSPSFAENLRKFGNFSVSAPGIILYALAVGILWIRFVDPGPYSAEVCTVRFGLVFVSTAAVLHFRLISRLTGAVKRNRKELLKKAALFVFAAAAGIVLTFLLRRAGILSGFSRGKTVIILFCLISLLVFFAGYLFNRISIDLMIMVTVFLVGSVYAVSFPVTTKVSWDDHIHYGRVLDLSLIDKSRISAADQTVLDHTYKGGAPGLLENGNSGEFTREINQLYESGNMVPFESDNMSVRLILPYLPLMIGLSVSRVFGLPYSFVFILGRWFGVLFYSFLVYLSVKQLRSGKMIVMVLSLCPIVLLQSSSYTYDTWIIGLSTLAFARFIGIMQDENRRFTPTDIAGICVLFIMGFSAKQVYCPLILSLLPVRREKLDERFPKALYYAVILFSFVLLAASFMVPFLTAAADSVKMGDIRGGSDIDSGKQLSFILGEPLAYAKILLGALKHYWSVHFLAVGLGFLGWLGPSGHELPSFILLLVIVVLDKSRADVYVTNAIRRIWTLLLAFGTSAVIGTSMYLSFTPVRAGTIEGFQMRYVLPILIFVGYYISDYRLVRPIRKIISDKLLFSAAEIGMVSFSMYAIYVCCLSFY